MRPDAINEVISACSRRAGIEHVTPHRLRHAFGSNLADAGGGLDEIAALDGACVDEFVAGLPASRPCPAAGGRRPGSQPARAGRDRPVSAAEAVQVTTVGGAHVFADTRIDRHAAAIAALIDPAFLTEAGWDPARRVLSFDPEHPLLGRPVCLAAGCATTAPAASRICASCRRRLAEHGLGEHQIASLPPRGRQRSGRGPDACAVEGCAREWESARSGLCSAHAEQWRSLPGVSVDQYLTHPAEPLPPLDFCAVTACTRQRRHPDGLYCGAHQQRLRTTRTRDPRLDETRWQATEPAIGRGGEVSLRGLPPLVVAELLVGLKQRCRINAVKTSDAVLRKLCNDIRRQQVSSLTDYVVDDWS